MPYTIRHVPAGVDRALRQWARREGKSLNEVVVDALEREAGVTEESVRRRDLTGIAGSWAEDPEIDEALRAQDRIDENLRR